MYIEYVQGVIKSSNQYKTTIHDKKKFEKKNTIRKYLSQKIEIKFRKKQHQPLYADEDG